MGIAQQLEPYVRSSEIEHLQQQPHSNKVSAADLLSTSKGSTVPMTQQRKGPTTPSTASYGQRKVDTKQQQQSYSKAVTMELPPCAESRFSSSGAPLITTRETGKPDLSEECKQRLEYVMSLLVKCTMCYTYTRKIYSNAFWRFPN